MYDNLKNEFHYFLEHQDELVQKYNGKFIVLKNCQVIGIYDSDFEAVTESSKTEEMGTFLVQHCIPGKDAYIRVYHSRVAFA